MSPSADYPIMPNDAPDPAACGRLILVDVDLAIGIPRDHAGVSSRINFRHHHPKVLGDFFHS
jgi:hypothetical protein